MNIISWNARGLNDQAKQRVLKRKFQKFNLEIMFIQETKCSISSMAKINKKIGRNINYLEVESQGREGSLATLWDTRDIQVIYVEANKQFIAVEAQTTGNSESFLCVNVYGPQRTEEKISFLNSLNKLIARYPRSKCIIGGDFNMITTLLEKKGGIRKLNKDAEVFTSFINDVKLVDILPKSGNFTWNNRRGGERLIASCLDRFLISENIIMDGITIESDILPTGGSDHWPISLTIAVQSTLRNKPFRFENFWLDHPNFLKQEETLWNQKSRIQWLKEGEQNTKFFHRPALDYRSANKILEMKNKDGEPLNNHNDISALLREHSNSIAQEPQLEREEAIKELLKAIPKSINSD
eukprot:PITA_26820